jgi:glycosyltransferase involved in cell wall biosynthesis
MLKDNKIESLYLTRNGLLEPLGQSQILPYLRGISKIYQTTLITFEKNEDWLNKKYFNSIKRECEELGILWLPQRFYKRPRLIAPLFSIIKLFILTLTEIKRRKIKIIHARSYVPGFVAAMVSFVIKIPFIFDMRALWPEELITAGIIKRGSILNKLLLWVEKTCLQNADAIVVLTNASEKFLNDKYHEIINNKQIRVIPTCVDLDRFKMSRVKNDEKVIGCMGSLLSGWFKIDLLGTFFSAAALRSKDLKFQITTKDDHKEIMRKFEKYPVLQGRISINSASPDKVSEILQKQIYSVMFYDGGKLSEIGRSPTRMAEILATGLPVVAYTGVGDVDSILLNNRVGVILKGSDAQQIEIALDELDDLFHDLSLSLRCRKLAEENFSTQIGIKKYLEIYENVLK